MPQLFYEVIWETAPYNNPADWPEDGSQPFVWSFGDGQVHEYLVVALILHNKLLNIN